MAARRIPVYPVYNVFDHTPLALGMIFSFARSYKGGVLRDAYDFKPAASSNILRTLGGTRDTSVFLCSDYIWSSAHNLKTSQAVKRLNPGAITIHGGPHVPKYVDTCQSFLRQNPYVDIAIRGEGELTIAALLEQLANHPREYKENDRSFLSNVRGITYRDGDRFVRTEDRPRVQEVDSLPSPYLTGEFRDKDAKYWDGAILETNRGCPYGCTFATGGRRHFRRYGNLPSRGSRPKSNGPHGTNLACGFSRMQTLVFSRVMSASLR